MNFPQTIKAEVKFTTAAGIMVPLRELKVQDARELILVAALFFNGEGNCNGEWLILDALRTKKNEELSDCSLTQARLLAEQHAQPSLRWLMDILLKEWPPLLHAFMAEALESHEAVLSALGRHHQAGTLLGRLPGHEILHHEHRANIQAIIDKHTEQGAGRIFQDFFAYLLTFAGYDKITVNPVGVPDVTASRKSGPEDLALGHFTATEAARLIELCRAAGETVLERKIRSIFN